MKEGRREEGREGREGGREGKEGRREEWSKGGKGGREGWSKGGREVDIEKEQSTIGCSEGGGTEATEGSLGCGTSNNECH